MQASQPAQPNFDFKYSGKFPDKVKLIKTISLSHLEFTAVGSIDPRSGHFTTSYGCKETILGGRLIYKAASSSIEYRYTLPSLPTLGRAVLSAEWKLGSSWKTPRVQLGMALSDDSPLGDNISMEHPGQVKVRRSIIPTRHLGVEAQGDIAFELRDLSAGLQGLSIGCNLQELNLVYRI